MLLHYLATLFIASTTAYRVLENSYEYVGDANELSWSESYTVKAARVSLTANIEEDFTVWKTNVSSRVDCNKGAYKLIANQETEDDDTVTVKVMIRPETTEEELNVIKCHRTRDSLFSKRKGLDDILPRVDQNEYIAVVVNVTAEKNPFSDNETVGDGIEATKFEFTDYDEEYKLDVKETLWAAYSEDFGWVPLKWEIKKYNDVLASLVKHDIWTFFEYNPEVEDEDVFDPEKLGCDPSMTVEHTAYSEKVTKELYFIDSENKKHVDHVFNHFKNKYNRQHEKENEHALRKAIFRESMKLVETVNRRNLTYKLGINEFSDWTQEEKQMTLGIISKPIKGVKDHATSFPFPYDAEKLQNELPNLPKEYDMRVEGLISPVKNQDRCGSCWTFAAAAVMEGALARVNGGRVLSLSNQAIIDCAYGDIGEHGAGGCHGGFDYIAYDFMENHGLPTDQEYGPYKMRDGFCNIGNMTKTYSIQGYTKVTKYSANAMRIAVLNHGPLYVYVHVSDEFRAYSSGIFYQSEDRCPPEFPNHAVAMVGYGDIDGEPFFILKNSYGPTWGDDGYILISARDNVCGVQFNPTYPVL